MEDCVFCRIIRGETPAFKIYEDENTLAFLDVFPRAEGHTLVIPKQHVQTLNELPEEKVAPFFKGVQKVSKKLINKLGAKGFNIGSNNGDAAGQAVPHLHIHIIPRYEKGAGFEQAFPVKEELKSRLKEISGKINI